MDTCTLWLLWRGLAAAVELPDESSMRGVVYVQWVRSGLREQPYVILEFGEQHSAVE